MSAPPRRARVRALAKINLDLRVLGKRPDGYHELRTIFQTDFAGGHHRDRLHPGAARRHRTGGRLAIPDNLVTRAAATGAGAMRATGRVEMRLVKRIPMGAGLGGGSSDAAAVLLALPVLAGAQSGAGRTLSELGAAARQRRAIFPAGRRRRWESAAARSCFRCPTGRRTAAFWWRRECTCDTARGVSRPEPPFDKRIATK